MVTRVGMEKVEERFVLHLDQVRGMFAVSLLEILQGLLLVAGEGNYAGHAKGVDITLASWLLCSLHPIVPPRRCAIKTSPRRAQGH